jgi:5-formyltetrahydrofolate cyclo-ligase
MEKEQFRAMIRAGPPVAPETSASVVRGLFDWMSPRLPGTVSAFLAMSGEVDVSDLFDRLPGWRWLLPRVEDDSTMTFRDRSVTRETHRFGMQQPADAGPRVPVHEIDIILTPGLAFDRGGGRLGNGAGFYDRALAVRRSDSASVGVTVADRVLEAVPMEQHDQRVDWLATEMGVRECSPRR